MEIHASNEPIALLYLPGRRIKPFKIKPVRGKYFVLYNKFIKGIFEMNEDRTYYWGKTPIYHYHFANSTAMDPILVNELNKYCRTNNLTKIKQKDVKHGASLRNLFSKNKDKTKSKEVLEIAQKQQGAEMVEGIENGLSEMKEYVDGINSEREEKQKIQLDEAQQSIFLLKYLVTNGLIEQSESDTFVYKIQNNIINFVQLIDELRDRKIIEINTPLDLNAQIFLEDFGSQNPAELAGFIDDLRTNKKDLKTLTATPVKQWIPASIVLAVILGGAMAAVLLAQNFDAFSDMIPKGFSLPGLFIKSIIS